MSFKQDGSMKTIDKMMDYKLLEELNNHRVSYGHIGTELQICDSTNTIKLTIKHGQCDLINMLDLVIPSAFRIDDTIESIHVECGGHRFDSVYNATQIKVTGQLYHRSIYMIDGKMFVPLALAPFHKHNVVPPSLSYHDNKIFIKLKKAVPNIEDWYICGMRYFLEDSYKNKNMLKSHTAITHQQQYWGGDSIKKGVNRIRLNLNHHVRLIYFWGINKVLIRKIRLLLDDLPFFEGTVHELERAKCLFGYSDIDEMMVIFSNEAFNKFPQSTINFCTIKNAYLEVETDEDEGIVHICGVNINECVWSCGMIGMRFNACTSIHTIQ